MKQQLEQISTDPVLNDNVLTLEKETPVTGEQSKEMKHVSMRHFTLTCPYRVRDSGIYLAKPWGLLFFETGIPRPITKDRVKSYVTSYFRFFNPAGTISQVTTPEEDIRETLYEQPQPALDNREPLNAFEAKGILYILKPTE